MCTLANCEVPDEMPYFIRTYSPTLYAKEKNDVCQFVEPDLMKPADQDV